METTLNKESASEKEMETGKLRKKVIIRAIKEVEKNLVCFGSKIAGYCTLKECIWREDCA